MANQTLETFGYPGTLIKKYRHWMVLLRQPQVTLGSLVLCVSDDSTRYSELPAAAHCELSVVIAEIENALTEAFAYDKINYLMLMMLDPHVHFHVIPRYAEQRVFGGREWHDTAWPKAPRLEANVDMSASDAEALRRHLVDFF